MTLTKQNKVSAQFKKIWFHLGFSWKRVLYISTFFLFSLLEKELVITFVGKAWKINLKKKKKHISLAPNPTK